MHPQTSPKPPSHPTTSTRPAEQDLDGFIYLISHDVRGSVRALMEIPQWIEEDIRESGFKLTSEIESHISLLNRHASRLDRMLVDLLSYSRVGRLQLATEIDCKETIETVLDQMKKPKDFSVTTELIHPTLRMGDIDALTLFTALISNAIKHNNDPNGKLLIRSRIEKNEFVLEALDNGPGIPVNMREQAFEVMRTLRPRDEVEGSGMGLAIIQKISAFYGGCVSLSTGIDGAGTCVQVRIPLKSALN